MIIQEKLPAVAQSVAPTVEKVIDWSEALTRAGVHLGIALAVAMAAHLLLFLLLDRAARLSASPSDELVFHRLRQPVRWALAAVAVSIAAEGNALIARFWGEIARFAVPALLGWVIYALVKAFTAVLDNHAQGSADPVDERSRRTRIAILSRTLSFVIVFVTVALMLFAIPGVRAVGVTLMASAGVATLAVGAAAQPALKSLIAGMQIALTEPLRLGDHVVIDGEGGRVEDIRLSYVVIRTGDERRVIVPTARFLDSSFQNWTRVGGGIAGSVVVPIHPGHPIEPIRAAYLRLLAAHDSWDGRTGSLRVSDSRIDAVDLQMTMSAADPSALATLRFAMREALLEWLRVEMPEAFKPN